MIKENSFSLINKLPMVGSKMQNQYDFKYQDNGNTWYYEHRVFTEQNLTKDEINTLGEILKSFPHFQIRKPQIWRHKLLQLDIKLFPSKLLMLAANAYDSTGLTMLGVACDYGYSVSAVQRLIDMGANLNQLDVNEKLAMHWAICNRFSVMEPDSYEAAEVVRCLLDNGAGTDIVCYQNMTPLEYAESRGYIAAANLIKEYHKQTDYIRNTIIREHKMQHASYTRGATIGLLKDIFPPEVNAHISAYLDCKDSGRIAQARKDAYKTAIIEEDEAHHRIKC